MRAIHAGCVSLGVVLVARAFTLLGFAAGSVECIGGACTGSQTLCTPDGGSTYCANTQTDNSNCGSCGAPCGSGQVCLNGACSTCGSLTPCASDGGATACVSTQTDNANCGACGVACGNGQTCSDGQCVGTCASPLIECSGTCTNTQNDPNNCGDCAAACASANATAFCSAGVCGLACQAGFSDCDLRNANGCEVQTSVDVDNCGACGVACATAPRTLCVAGECVGWLSEQSWTDSSGSSNAALGVQSSSNAADGKQFTYSDTTTDATGAEQSFTFEAVATSAFTLNYSWQFQGNHSDAQATASLQAFADSPVGTTTVALVPSQSVSGDFAFSGTGSLTIVSGYNFGFIAKGQCFASSTQLSGNLIILQ